MRARQLLVAVTAGLVMTGCRSDRYEFVNPFEPREQAAPGPGEDAHGWGDAESSGQMLGWDGSPVGKPGARRIDDNSLHPLEETGGSRLVLLDLYQRAVEERDEYLLEVEAQNTAIELAEKRYRTLEARFVELQAAFDALGAEKQQLETQRQELAARLTTAQIRRLEAEKAWLEAAIEWRTLNDINQLGIEKAAADDGEPDQ